MISVDNTSFLDGPNIPCDEKTMDENKKICIEVARLAKQKAVELYGDLDAVNGIGISRVDGSYSVRINLRHSPDEQARRSGIKSEIDGVPVIVKIVGEVKKSIPIRKTAD